MLEQWFGKPVARGFAIIVMVGVSAYLIRITWTEFVIPIYGFFETLKREHLVAVFEDGAVLMTTIAVLAGLFGIASGFWLWISAHFAGRKLEKLLGKTEILHVFLDCFDDKGVFDEKKFLEEAKKVRNEQG